MREIKFRGWDEDLKMMMPEVDISAPLQSFKWLGRVDLPIMQYTGLKDKNGKEIYEGDIFNCHYSDETKNHHKWQVVWNDKSAGFVLSRIGEPCNQKMVTQRVSDYSGWRGEIIGNIYENKELLTNHE